MLEVPFALHVAKHMISLTVIEFGGTSEFIDRSGRKKKMHQPGEG